MVGNKKIMGDNIQYYMDKMGIDRHQLSKALKIPYSSLTDWINGKSYPRIDKIELMANYFSVSKADLVEEHTNDSNYYLNNETKKIAQEVFENPELRILFDAAQDAEPQNLILAAEMLKRMKGLND
jgi:transcriptional regulator with XRE-family HTH domain